MYSYENFQSNIVEIKHEFVFDERKQFINNKRIYLQGAGTPGLGKITIQSGKSLTVNVTYKYDNDGFLIKQEQKVENPSILTGEFYEGSTEYVYESGKLVKELNTFSILGANGILVQQPYTFPTIYKYDSQARLISIDEVGGTKHTYTYNADGLASYARSTVKEESFRYIYRNGRVIREDHKSDTRNPDFDLYTLHLYDSDGQLTGQEKYKVDGGLYSKDEYIYDGQQRPIEVFTRYNYSPFPSKSTFLTSLHPKTIQYKGHPQYPSFFGTPKSNLLTTKLYSVESGVTKLVSQSNYTYKYNKMGYPTELIIGGSVYRWAYCKNTY